MNEFHVRRDIKNAKQTIIGTVLVFFQRIHESPIKCIHFSRVQASIFFSIQWLLCPLTNHNFNCRQSAHNSPIQYARKRLKRMISMCIHYNCDVKNLLALTIVNLVKMSVCALMHRCFVIYTHTWAYTQSHVETEKARVSWLYVLCSREFIFIYCFLLFPCLRFFLFFYNIFFVVDVHCAQQTKELRSKRKHMQNFYLSLFFFIWCSLSFFFLFHTMICY